MYKIYIYLINILEYLENEEDEDMESTLNFK